MQVLYLGRAPRTKETLLDFRENGRVTRQSQVFRGLTGSQRTRGFWGVTFSANPTVISFRGKKESCSTQSELRVDSGFESFDKLCEVGVSPYLGFSLHLSTL